MACPDNHSPGAAEQRRSLLSMQRVLLAALYGEARTPTGSVNRGQVLKSNPPILTSIKESRGEGGLPRALKAPGKGPL
ncbi:hypothetical protein PBY51_010991 [Eleginops maclovinus]|uniref:Uncharacterized protein n=1 Tax=Eleginops maclovinus TaxID=56733 RepID=A0AAN8ACL7_ELEMC|nr:hypothetical protein PBY51_010991 [Eleginops maclovinus]